jgi:hypothetical protein
MTPPGDFTFEEYEVVTGPAKRQTVLTGFLLGGAMAELAVVHIDEKGDRRLRIYEFGDGNWVPMLDATLRPEVMFVDVADIAGRDRLVTYGGGRLNWFDPESTSERPLVAVNSDFKPPPRGEVLHVDVTRDVNDDGRDDLVVPAAGGFRVFIQMEGGVFADPVNLGTSPKTGRIYGADGYRYKPWVEGGRVHEMDYDRDGRSDLVFWNEDHFEVHHQDERGLFTPVAKTFTTDVAFDSDELASLAAPHGVRHRLKDHNPTGHITGRVLHTLTDMNGDGVADLVVFSLHGGDLWNMHSTYEVHFGTPTTDGVTAFSPDVGTAIPSDGIPFGMGQHDFDHDGQVDVMFITIKPGFFKVIGLVAGAMLTHSISLDLELYRMEEGTYPDKPSDTRTVKAAAPPRKTGTKAAGFPSVLFGDVNGDGRSDLLVGQSRKELRVFVGVPGPDLFARRPNKVAVAMPLDEEYTWLVDFNKDGKQDVLMHHPSPTQPHRVTILIAR